MSINCLSNNKFERSPKIVRRIIQGLLVAGLCTLPSSQSTDDPDLNFTLTDEKIDCKKPEWRDAAICESPQLTPEIKPAETDGEGKYDYLFEGIDIVPDDTPKKPLKDSDKEEGGGGTHDSDPEELNFRTPDTCQFG